MKTSLLAGLSLLAPGIFALHKQAGSSQPIYILKTSEPATNALSKALDTLGYSRQGSQEASSSAYIEVTSDAQLTEIGRTYPEAKFIIPQGRRHPMGTHDLSGIGAVFWGRGACTEQRSSQHDWSNHTVFEEKRLQGLLELDVLTLEAGAQAENWVALCEFLGMGYSVVERLGLWHFPQ
ncbi:hypothetical protein F5Y06DRAFT_139330 [Hypoxylon sp. FL0890]|nr:hypothetical protein F5Y06DRAFT_139330 [Hypoxylon sp. FL0890]